MSIFHRTYRVTCLRVIDLLSTRRIGALRESHQKSFGDVENVSERKPEVFWRNQKLFRSKPSSRKSFGMHLEFLEGCHKSSRTSQNFPEGTLAQKHIVPTRETRSPFSWGLVLGGAPLWGQPPFGGSLLGPSDGRG